MVHGFGIKRTLRGKKGSPKGAPWFQYYGRVSVQGVRKGKRKGGMQKESRISEQGTPERERLRELNSHVFLISQNTGKRRKKEDWAKSRFSVALETCSEARSVKKGIKKKQNSGEKKHLRNSGRKKETIGTE